MTNYWDEEQFNRDEKAWRVEFAARWAARSWIENPTVSLEGHLWIWRHIVGLEEKRPTRADFPDATFI